jgi:mannose-1-phosphate guanylyltransferase
VGDKINAGIYVLSPAVLNRIELRPTSIEKEVFPHIAVENKLFAYTLPGYWMDVGQPKDFLRGEPTPAQPCSKHRSSCHVLCDRIRPVRRPQNAGWCSSMHEPVAMSTCNRPSCAPHTAVLQCDHGGTYAGLGMHLDSVRMHQPQQLASGSYVRGNVLVAPSAKIGENCVIGPDVSISDDCVIGNGVRLTNCTIMKGCVVRGSLLDAHACCVCHACCVACMNQASVPRPGSAWQCCSCACWHTCS